MIAFIRNLAGIWADNRLISANNMLRRRLIAAEARADRLAQSLEHLRRLNLANFGARCRAETELEQALVAQSGKGVLDRAWVDAAGVAGPEARQP